MSAEFVPNSAIDRVEGFLKFASDRLAPHQVEDLRVVVQTARAAPALYEALEGLVELLGKCPPAEDCARCKAAEAALRKARGDLVDPLEQVKL